MGKELTKNLFWGNLNMVQIYGERTEVNALAPKISNLTQLANEYWSHEDTIMQKLQGKFLKSII